MRKPKSKNPRRKRDNAQRKIYKYFFRNISPPSTLDPTPITLFFSKRKRKKKKEKEVFSDGEYHLTKDSSFSLLLFLCRFGKKRRKINSDKIIMDHTNQRSEGLISVDRSNKATLLLTIPRSVFKSSAKDWTLPAARNYHSKVAGTVP